MAAPAVNGYLTDLWWTPDESGWGANIVQQDETSFVTLFVYSPDGSPVWYVAPSARMVGLTNLGLPVVAGPLYKVRGPWFGRAFDPASVQATQVGEVSIEPTSAKDAVFRYRIDGESVRKNVTRQSWGSAQSIELRTAYNGTMSVTSRIGTEPPQVVRSATRVEFSIDQQPATVTISVIDDRCTFYGPIQRHGKFSTVRGGYRCVSGQTGTAELSELEVTRHGFTAKLTMTHTNGYLRGVVVGIGD
jgi:hypothetical protein